MSITSETTEMKAKATRRYIRKKRLQCPPLIEAELSDKFPPKLYEVKSGKLYNINSSDYILKNKKDIKREIISILCPICECLIDWDKNWDCYICRHHGEPLRFEVWRQ